MQSETASDERLLSADVMARYKITKMTLWRWEKDPELDFPQAIRIRKRRYWMLADLKAFDKRQREKQAATCAAS